MSTVFWYCFKMGISLTLAWMAHVSEACRADVSLASRAHVSVASRAHALLGSWAPTCWSHIWIKEHVAASCRLALSGFGTRYSTLGLQVSYASVQDFGSQWLPGHSAPGHHWHSGYAFGGWYLPPMQGAFLPQGHPQWYVHRGELLGEHGGYFEQHASPIEPCGEQDEDHGWSFLITAELGKRPRHLRHVLTLIWLSLFLFPLGFETLAAMASWGTENVLKEVDDLEGLQEIRPNALALPKLLEAMEHKIKAIDTLTSSMLLKLAKNFPCSFEKQLAECAGWESKQCLCRSFETPN